MPLTHVSMFTTHVSVFTTQVFEAVETESQLSVAAKIFNEGDDDEAGKRKRLALAQHEFDVVGFLSHDNIVRVHGLVVTESSVCIVQELVTGGDLFGAVLDEYGLPANQVVSRLGLCVSSYVRGVHLCVCVYCATVVHCEVDKHTVSLALPCTT